MEQNTNNDKEKDDLKASHLLTAPACLTCALGLRGPLVLKLFCQAGVGPSSTSPNRGCKSWLFVSDFGENDFLDLS